MDAQEAWYASIIPLRNQVIADVGANVGRLSEFFWEQSGGTSEVISIEPLTENVAAIEERISRRAAAPRWRVEAVAASDHDGEVALEAANTAGAGWNSTVLRDGRAGPASRRVPCRRLSGLVPHATVIKVDVEGHEYVLFDEALAALERAHTWALELHSVPDRPLEVTLARFIGHGFSLVAAGRSAREPAGPWQSVPIGADLSWERIPVARRLADGSPFRMLHVIARR
jgi:FkbM family methyltransferase